MESGCVTCGGGGVVHVRGHYTVTKPCPKCYGSAREQLELFQEAPRVIDLHEALRAAGPHRGRR